jgi:hypothetical protein
MKKLISLLLFAVSLLCNAKERLAILPPELVNGKISQSDIYSEFSSIFHTEILGKIADSGQFDLVSRKRVQDLVSEQEFSKSGFVSKKDAPKLGKLMGATHICFLEITKLDQKNIESNFPGTTEILIKEKVAASCSLTIAETETGKILHARVHSDQKEQLSGRKNQGLNIESKDKGLQISEVAKRMGGKVGISILRSLKPPRVIALKGNSIIINQGTNCAVEKGDSFIVVRQGKEIKDPDSGESLGKLEETVGKILVENVSNRSASAKILSGDGLQLGDFLQFQKETEK